MIEMDTLTYQMQNNLQEFIFHQPLLSELINSVQIHSEFLKGILQCKFLHLI